MSARILIVDDTALNVKLLATKLTYDYYVISTASNGVEALQSVAKEKPDLILLDVMMPEMDGFETCRRLKADPATAHIPIIIITALTDVTDRVRGLAAGADDFLAKPINDIALMARIRSLLRFKVLLDEWRLREATTEQLLPPPDISRGEAAEEIANSKILVIDDNGSDCAFLQSTLGPLSVHITNASSVAEGEAQLAVTDFNLVFASIDLRSEDGLVICPRMRVNTQTRHIPLLLLANPDEIDRVAKGLDLGANDYLMRPFDPQEMFARARTQLRHKLYYDRMREAYEQNLKMALVDPLTGAFNRRYLDAHLPRLLVNAAENGRSLSVQMMDLDNFKMINDRYGHGAGDEVLREIAHRISNGVRPSDFFVRFGGEEFAVVMPDTRLPHALSIAERLRQSVGDKPVTLSKDQMTLSVTISIGIADSTPDHILNASALLERADQALYRAKNSGRNKVIADPAHSHIE